MVTPFQRSQLTTYEKQKYNYIQSRARRCVEQFFGVWKKIFRILVTTTEHSRAQKVADTHCCALLHNLLLRYRADSSVNPDVRAEMDLYYARLLAEVNMELALAPLDRERDANHEPVHVSGAQRRLEVLQQVQGIHV